MKIVVDARWIFPEISGIGAYTVQLLDHLAQLDSENDYALLFQDAALRDRTLASPSLARAKRFQAHVIPYGLFSLRNQWELPRLLAREQADIYHSTNYMMPLRMPGAASRVRRVATIHDVIPLALPNHAPQSKKARLFPLYRFLMRQIGRRADAIVTDSQASKDDMIRHLGIPAASQNRVRVVPLGVSDLFQPIHAEKPDNMKTVLYVGRQDPYKNLAGLVRVFAELKKIAPMPVRLIVAGSPDPRYPEPFRLARELNVADAIECTGYLSLSDLVRTYGRADVLAHPSFYEGFGLQALEAMACGLPVVCSNRTSLPEVVGDAARLVDPDDVPAFARALADVLTQPDLATMLSVKGIEQASRFDWKKTARETLRVYADVAGGNPKA